MILVSSESGDYISREAAIAVIEEKQKELCPVGMYGRYAVYGSDREKFDAWQEIIDALESIPAADVRSTEYCEECRDALLKTIDHYKQLCADVRPALWTDEPIIGTWFMTHNQGQSGFEIHFRTDDKAKYEAVQDECRRQIDHAKPAADVRPVVRRKWIDHQEGRWIYAKCSECGTVHDVRSNFCPNCGADMREES